MILLERHIFRKCERQMSSGGRRILDAGADGFILRCRAAAVKYEAADMTGERPAYRSNSQRPTTSIKTHGTRMYAKMAARFSSEPPIRS